MADLRLQDLAKFGSFGAAVPGMSRSLNRDEEEEKRQDLIRQRDNVVSSTYGKIHEKMLGYKGSAGY